jgi:nucleoside 2-deoxyribosyltransferase
MLIDCPLCGHFSMTGEAKDEFIRLSEKERGEVSSWIKYRTLGGGPRLSLVSTEYAGSPEGKVTYNVRQILDIYSPKSLRERLDRIMLNLSRLSDFQGAMLAVNSNLLYVFQAFNDLQMKYYYDDLIKKEWLIGKPLIPSEARITPDGWDHISQLEKGGGISKQTFVAMAFDERLDLAWKQGLELGIDQAGFVPFRIDRTEHNQKICDLIIAEINKSAFLVADVTYHRQGVYFEAGYALGLGMPVIWCCRADQVKRCHFDTRQYNHIIWNTPEELREKIKNRIEATIKSPRA